MARKAIDVRIRLKRKEEKIAQLTHKLEEEKEEYQKLFEEAQEEEKKRLFEAYQKSSRTYEEVIDFLGGKADI